MNSQAQPTARARSLIVVILALSLTMITVVQVHAQDFGAQRQGVSVYDRAGILTPEEIATIEDRVNDVNAAGAPTIVYLQAEEADFDETLQDGRELMEDWDVQSAPGARDGIVIFLNLDPDDLRHGQVALVAGESHFDGGNLPQYELDRITSEMREILGDEETARGIATGLEMIAQSLETGPAPPPEPSRAEEISRDLAGGILSPVNILAVLVTAATGFVGTRVLRTRPQDNRPVVPVVTPPGDLIPAAAGALVTGKVSDMQMEATMLDLARRGALAIEPEDEKDKVQVRLIDSDVPENDVEQQVWNALEQEATDGVVSSKGLTKIRSHWKPAKDALQEGLEARGWFDPDASRKRRPAYIAGALALLLAIIAVIISAIASRPEGLIGAGMIAAAGIFAFIAGASYLDLTEEGAAEATAWKGYLKGMKDAGSQDGTIDLDLAVPFAVAMNARNALDERLKAVSESDYVPAWLGQSMTAQQWGAAGFYPYWASFHAGVSPSVGAGAGGAAAGSGGSGGGF